MGDRLRLELPPPLDGIEASHVTSERDGARKVDLSRAACLLFCVQGTLEIRLKDGGVALRGLDAFLLAPEGAGGATLRCSAGTDYYLVRFHNPPLPRQAAGPPLLVPSDVVVRGSARLTHLLHLCTEEAKGERLTPLIQHHLVILALGEIARCARDGVGGPAGERCVQSMASSVDAYIAAHYHEAISTPQIARQLHYNPSYLERAYRQECGSSIRGAINARRIREACAQLRISRKQGIAEIAALCGYNDPGYFRRAFKRAVHMTPHGYRAADGCRMADATGFPADPTHPVERPA